MCNSGICELMRCEWGRSKSKKAVLSFVAKGDVLGWVEGGTFEVDLEWRGGFWRESGARLTSLKSKSLEDAFSFATESEMLCWAKGWL